MDKEPIVVIVGFLGTGKTTLLKMLVKYYLSAGMSPQVILNDYENAKLDAERFSDILESEQMRALSGSCICCSGLSELRSFMNASRPRDKAISLIEANGTTDATALAEFLAVGLDDRFLPPVQLSVVDARYWQKRGRYNDLERNQVRVASLIVLNLMGEVSGSRNRAVKEELQAINPAAKILSLNEVAHYSPLEFKPVNSASEKFDHGKAHWASCSIELPPVMSQKALLELLDALPDTILRVKGCTRISGSDYDAYFERVPSGAIKIKPFPGQMLSGPTLITVGPGSEPTLLEDILRSIQPKKEIRNEPLAETRL